MSATLYEKVFDAHAVRRLPSGQYQLLMGLHLIHEVTSPQAFSMLRDRNLPVLYPQRTFATVDHIIPTHTQARPLADPLAEEMLQHLERNCAEHGIRFLGPAGGEQGIVHVIGPERGLTQPGMTICCGDSHTSTHGAFGAIAFGIGTSQVRDVLATQTLAMDKLRVRRIEVNGRLRPGVYAKDVILWIINRLGVHGGVGYAYEYAGEVFDRFSMEERMTVCNMSIEGGARAGLVAPDDTTFQYLCGRDHAPKGAEWDAAIARWTQLPTDDGAAYDRSVTIDADALEPMITFGTNPGMGVSINAPVPDPAQVADPMERDSITKALLYMGLEGGKPLVGHPIDVVFIGSCTNSRISDLRTAASLLKGRHVNPKVRVMVVPGSQEVKRLAIAEGLPELFRAAGCEWREPGCSMCIAMNGDQLSPGQYSVSTSNRNFEGRQGKGGRTFLASPLTAAASALTGVVTDVRTLL
jgi:3-isopropylmalate/(R)-2-methylmalate dehydratase large subunit